MSLCCVCVATFKDGVIPSSTQNSPYEAFDSALNHHATIPSFLASVKSTDPCYICSSLFNRLTDYGRVQFEAVADKLAQTEAEISKAVVKSGGYATRLEVKMLGQQIYPQKGTGMIVGISGEDPSIRVVMNPEHLQVLDQIRLTQSSIGEKALPWIGLESEKASLMETVREACDSNIHGEWIHLAKLEEGESTQLEGSFTVGLSNERNWSIILNWLENCAGNHTVCRERRDRGLWYPTRLVDIGTERAPDFPRGCFRLIQRKTLLGMKGRLHHLLDRDNLQRRTGYLTLSHRWGGASILKLSRANFAQFEAGMPLSSLSKTFQDAAVVLRRLGMRYMWIDSLCIIQDDERDWAIESLTMEKVYRNAVCNISADWASKSPESEGLFRNRKAEDTRPPRITLRVAPAENKATDPAEEKSQTYQFHHSDFFCRAWKEEVALATLNTRAWVVQERLLSARVVHFSRSQLFWECCEASACEFLPTRFSRDEGGDFNLKGYAHSRRDEGINSGWLQIVETYQRCNLTVPTDKLIAFAGLAKFAKTYFNDQYVAGIWMSRPHNLVWRVTSPSRTCADAIAAPYRAPSWSWASVDDAVTFPKPESQAKHFVEMVCVNFRGRVHGQRRVRDGINSEDVFGPLLSHTVELRLKGTLRPCKLEKERPKAWIETTQPLGWVIRPMFDHSVDTSEIPACLDFHVDEAEVVKMEQGKFYYVMCVGQLEDHNFIPDEDNMTAVFYGIILQPKDVEMSRFKRVGTFSESKALDRSQGALGNYSVPWWPSVSSTETIYVE